MSAPDPTAGERHDPGAHRSTDSFWFAAGCPKCDRTVDDLPASPPAVAASTGTSEDVPWADERYRSLVGYLRHSIPAGQAVADLDALLAAREAAARAEAWEAAADLADTQIVLWSGVPGLHPTEPEPHPAAIAAAGARRTLTVLRSRMSEAFDDLVAREGR